MSRLMYKKNDGSVVDQQDYFEIEVNGYMVSALTRLQRNDYWGAESDLSQARLWCESLANTAQQNIMEAGKQQTTAPCCEGEAPHAETGTSA